MKNNIIPASEMRQISNQSILDNKDLLDTFQMIHDAAQSGEYSISISIESMSSKIESSLIELGYSVTYPSKEDDRDIANICW